MVVECIMFECEGLRFNSGLLHMDKCGIKWVTEVDYYGWFYNTMKVEFSCPLKKNHDGPHRGVSTSKITNEKAIIEWPYSEGP